MSQPHTRGASARTLAFPDSPLEDRFLIHLREHARGLKKIVSVLTVSILALRAQDAELDHDIATVKAHKAIMSERSGLGPVMTILRDVRCGRRSQTSSLADREQLESSVITTVSEDERSITLSREDNLPASVRQRLLNVARERQEDLQLLLVRYALERLLYRKSCTRR